MALAAAASAGLLAGCSSYTESDDIEVEYSGSQDGFARACAWAAADGSLRPSDRAPQRTQLSDISDPIQESTPEDGSGPYRYRLEGKLETGGTEAVTGGDETFKWVCIVERDNAETGSEALSRLTATITKFEKVSAADDD
ncbi:hypothetical protein [Homoserinibacter sp. YIM 151385]|uniref:hypothetical protein n=1 Tax=Homoserinibacter sp. YIM 151385 TaxID=2985506 RepID=UPI0022F0B74C|nr:hypothetical protein [Homoserinibacter sp. YIM 151385]WBU36909.1 hypothetical protein OF852_08170 [Homoserinibacter sp. YIM 151385]